MREIQRERQRERDRERERDILITASDGFCQSDTYSLRLEVRGIHRVKERERERERER